MTPEQIRAKAAAVRSLVEAARTRQSTGDLGHALQAATDAVALARELYLVDSRCGGPRLASSLNCLGVSLGAIGKLDEALLVRQESAHLYAQLVLTKPEAFLPVSAMRLAELGSLLRARGREADALAIFRQAVERYRDVCGSFLYDWSFKRNLADALCQLSAILQKTSPYEALEAREEALLHLSELAQDDPKTYGGRLAGCLVALSIQLEQVGRHEDALGAMQDAVRHYRWLVRSGEATFKTDLALSLGRVSEMLADRNLEEALVVAGDAMQLHREIAAEGRRVSWIARADVLNRVGLLLESTGRTEEAPAIWREAGGAVLSERGSDTQAWCRLAKLTFMSLDAPGDALNFHVPLLISLTERRELARSAEDATVFLSTQSALIGCVWALLQEHGDTHPELVEAAAPAIVSALHSPDLARWMKAELDVSAEDDSPPARLRRELARIKREVIAADEVYHGLLVRLRSSAGGSDTSLGLRELRDARGPSISPDELQRAADKAERRRQDYRAKRTELIAADPAFRGTFEVPTVQALRDDLRALSSQGLVGADSGETPSALLCLMTLKEAEQARAVGVLFSEAGSTPHLIEFPGLVDLAEAFSRYEPEGDRGGDASRPRPPYRRGPSTGEDAPVHATPPPQPALDDLVSRLQELFWRPLQDALRWTPSQGSPCAVLHVCGHGPLHQLPLAALAAQFAQAQLQLVQWPGLPYFRIAATGTAQEGEAAPWQLGHDCAWQQDQPLPMVAVEAHLLGALLDGHGRRVQWLSQASELQAQCAALVACCHGQHAAHFDSALALGELPLAVERIVAERLGPRAVLLPVCHAGETAEDAAGNALGVAAGFLLGGTRVVVASAKAVPDMVIPWFSTLMAWHMVAEDMGSYQAAVLARAEFGCGEFPPAYRAWLQRMLPRALQTIQPGGAEWPAITEACRVKAARSDVAEVPPAELVWWVAELWPWAGEPLLLFEDDPAKREAARQAAARHVLQRRSDDYGQEVRRMMREAAAFIFIYGCG